IVNVSDDLVQVELFCDGDDGDQPYNFSIDFGDGSNVSIPGNNSDDVTVFHNYTIGLFYSNCTIHDADGDVNISETIMINTSKPDFTPGFTVDLSLDSLTELNASNIATANFTCDVNGGSSPYSYGLNPGDGSGIGGIPPTTQDTISFSHDYSIGLFTANCTVIDNNSVMNISNNVIINISQPPPPGLIASLAIDSIQETQNSTFIVNSTCSVTGGTPLFSYGFDPGDNSGIAGIPPSSSTSAAFSHEYAEGLYTTNCSVTDGNSITNRSANILLNLTPTPIPAIRVATLTANVTHGDAPLSVGFNCSLENVTIPVQYGMNFGDGLVIVSPFSINNLSRLFNHTYETGFFNAQCAALDDDGVQVYSNFINITVTKPQNNAPIINSFFPSDTTPTIAESTSQLFNISASDPDLDNLSINFFVDNALVNSPTSSFIFNAPDVNESEIYFIRAEVSDGNLSVTQYWNLTVTPVPISDVLDGNTTNFSELPDIERADNVTLENQVSGRINFLETLNLSQVGDLDNSVVISNNLVSINSDALPQLNRSARITLRGLSYTTTPVIFFNEGFTTNPNEVNTPCDFCTLISFTPFPTTDGEVIFEVEHFSSFAVGQNQSTPTPAEPVIKKTKKDEFKIERLRLSNEVLQPGDTLVTATNIKNVGDKSTKTGKVTVVIPELGLRKRIGPFKVGKDDDILKQVALELPKDTPPGEYVVRITVSSQKERRVKHRFIRVD
ncbi:MAG: hypothetical protein QF632_06770, partial [Candidatus Woesearchaeota archaeon]|nr:hypothetical protein [Candidatus Woesearchaeota archaeon]